MLQQLCYLVNNWFIFLFRNLSVRLLVILSSIRRNTELRMVSKNHCKTPRCWCFIGIFRLHKCLMTNIVEWTSAAAVYPHLSCLFCALINTFIYFFIESTWSRVFTQMVSRVCACSRLHWKHYQEIYTSKVHKAMNFILEMFNKFIRACRININAKRVNNIFFRHSHSIDLWKI